MTVDYPVKWPLGIDVLKAQYKANSEKRLLAFQQPIIDEAGPNFKLTLLGAMGYTTMDPVNLEALLSSRFEGLLQHSRKLGKILTYRF